MSKRLVCRLLGHAWIVPAYPDRPEFGWRCTRCADQGIWPYLPTRCRGVEP